MFKLEQLRQAFLVALATTAATIGIIAAIPGRTPSIVDAKGDPIPGSIARLEKMKLGGVEQWLVVRGKSVDRPVLLFLSGGPGGSELGRVRRFNQALEDHFVVVVWEQRGTGKSYPAIEPKSALTVEQYVSDIIELTEKLKAQFNEDKIYLVGHSWGTIIGLRAAQQRPDLFYAYIGTAQMVNVRETDQIIYRAVLDHAEKIGDRAEVEKLKSLGEPPYTGDNLIDQYRSFFGKEFEIFERPHIRNQEYLAHSDIGGLLFIPEYSLLDKVNFVRGLIDTFNVVYPQLQDFDFRKDAPRLSVPVYFVLGRHDMNGTWWLAKDYFQKLQAPRKRLYIFEHTGHGQLWQEADRFHAIMTQTVLPETYPTPGTRSVSQIAPRN